MKFLVAFILTALTGFASALFLPWWTMAVMAFVVAVVVKQRSFPSFLAAFFSIFFLWGLQAFLIDLSNQHLLAAKVAQILPLGGSYIMLIVLTALVGGLVAGFAALTASFISKEV